MKNGQLVELNILTWPKVDTNNHKLVGATKAVGSINLKDISFQQKVNLLNLSNYILS